MSMDRRNKKAAQLAAGQANAQKDSSSKTEKSKSQKPSSNGSASTRTSSSRNGTQTGSTTSIRVPLLGSRPPLSISKAAPAPAEPAPTLNDTDFTTFDITKPLNQTSARAQVMDIKSSQEDNKISELSASDVVASPSSATAFPVSTPSQPVRFTGRHGSSSSVDFGPVGSPPRASPSTPIRINGFSPENSILKSSQSLQTFSPPTAFNVPGPSHSLITPLERNAPSNEPKRSGLAVALGSTRTFNVGSLPVLSQNAPAHPGQHGSEGDLVDDDMEEFVPSSLKDLLTPEEQSRRLSRASATASGIMSSSPSAGQHGAQELRHKHSRSVPASSILKDIRSIWAESNDFSQRQPDKTALLSVTRDNLHEASTYSRSSALLADDDPSLHILNPSNASAAFLPGLHNYMSKAPRMGSRAASHGNAFTHQGGPDSVQIDNMQSATPSYSHSLTARNSQSLDMFSTSPSASLALPPGRPIRHPDSSFQATEYLLSPSRRALQAHAPGQSLPQGLAAGYSRIHLQPPPTIPSPATSGTALSPTTNSLQATIESTGSPLWNSTAKQVINFSSEHSIPSAGSGLSDQMNEPDIGDLSTMFSRLSYSAATSRGPTSVTPFGPQSTSGSPAVPVSQSISRKTSTRAWNSHPLSSPLSGPVLTNDDDELFPMDEEK